jgi:kynurenine formamidase
MNPASANINWEGKSHEVDLSNPIDISLAIKDSRVQGGASAWYVDGPKFEPVKGEGFIGKVSEGGSVNFTDVYFNPHGHGTHTECLGHITHEAESIDRQLRREPLPALLACLIHTVEPELVGADRIILAKHLPEKVKLPLALVLRTLPNSEDKKVQTWDNTNPPYLDPDFTSELVARGVKHLLIDLPSVDKEVDGGALLSHRVFFGVPNKPRFDATITEFIFVPDSAEDGIYALNLQVSAFDLDASPSRPILFPTR